MTMQNVAHIFGYSPDTPPAPYGRYVDKSGVQWRIETDGEGGTIKVREKWVGRGQLDVVDARKELQANERQRRHRREQYPDPEAAIIEMLTDPMTIKKLAVLIGRRRYTVTRLVRKLWKRGDLERERGVSEHGMSEYLWSVRNG